MTKKAIIVLVVLLIVVVALWMLKKSPDQTKSTIPSSSAPSAASLDTSPATPPADSTQATVAPKVTPSKTSEKLLATIFMDIADFSFVPKIQIIRRGIPVTWTNHDKAIHTVTSDTGEFDSASLKQGQTFTYIFDKVGTYPYHCTPHPRMQGTITVIP